MKRFASVTFDGVLAACERDDAARSIGSFGATATSWHDALGRTYASATCARSVDLEAARTVIGARFDIPALLVWRIVPRFADRIAPLADALAGAGGLACVRDVRTDARELVVECDATGMSPLLLLALVDIEVGGRALRTIEPLVALDDTTLARIAGATLREPDLDASRLIETYLEPLLAGTNA